MKIRFETNKKVNNLAKTVKKNNFKKNLKIYILTKI